MTFFMIYLIKKNQGDSNMQKHTCKACGKSFVTKDDLMTHAKKVHEKR